MFQKISVILFLSFPTFLFGQTDTIFTTNEKIGCIVKEIGEDVVKYVYPGEEALNSVYKTSIYKIHFKSGRIQTFAESASLKTVRYAIDWENVALTQVEHEVRGFYKLGEVSAKAKGTTTLSSMDKVKDRAVRKLKIEAAMQGANIVYVTYQNSQGNQLGTDNSAGKTTDTNLSGVAYSNAAPKTDEFLAKFGSQKELKTKQKISLWSSSPDLNTETLSATSFILNKASVENGQLVIEGKMQYFGTGKFRVVYWENDFFVLYSQSGSTVYNFIISNK